MDAANIRTIEPGLWHQLIALSRLVHNTLDGDNQDQVHQDYPEPLETVRRRLLNVRTLLQAAAEDEATIRSLREQRQEALDLRDQALAIAHDATHALMMHATTNDAQDAAQDLQHELQRIVART